MKGDCIDSNKSQIGGGEAASSRLRHCSFTANI